MDEKHKQTSFKILHSWLYAITARSKRQFTAMRQMKIELLLKMKIQTSPLRGQP